MQIRRGTWLTDLEGALAAAPRKSVSGIARRDRRHLDTCARCLARTAVKQCCTVELEFTCAGSVVDI
eukprot:2288027-Rhodomonas_salina.2